jgi:hypothetical protein
MEEIVMSKWRSVVAMVAMATVASCSSTPKPIPLAGGEADLATLAGEWAGEYHSLSGGRKGTITFNLTAGADSASGEVLMFPPRQTPTMGDQTRPESSPVHAPYSLSISFVRAGNGRVTGRLDPYQDPECGCLVNTIFDGRVEGDEIGGTYVAQRSGASSMNGGWKVTRKK